MPVIAKLHRLTRSVKDLADLLERCTRRGVSLVSLAGSLDTRDAAGRWVLNIMVSVSQWEREPSFERFACTSCRKQIVRRRSDACCGHATASQTPPSIATQVCYTNKMPSVTSSFRMSKELQRQLSDAAERTGKPKNAIIIDALVKYLHAMERQSLAEEARRQSQLVSKNEHDDGWYGLADTSGWR
jgi:predicted DNA-binding protein